ncbi:MAG: GHKL domain-containing protein [Eubacteriales bacterium]|nr:GHKL domain-containing protein [Eubacteriales bacterium]
MLQNFGYSLANLSALFQSLLFWSGVFAGAFLMGSAARRLLPAGKGWVRRLAPYALFAVVIEMPSWIGDENPLFLFPVFVAVFLLCGGGTKLARLAAALMLFALVMPLNMMLDTVGFWGVWLDRDGFVGLCVKLAAWALFWLLVRRAVPEGTVSLPDRLWALIGTLSLAPVFAMLSFSIWGYHRRINFWDAYEDAVQPIAYTILPFVLLSAVAIVCAAVVLSRHETREREHQLADMREVYYQGVRREQRQVRALRHDLRNHLAALSGLLAEGETGKARAYLEELSQSPALHGGRRFCENETVNAVLASKAVDMERAGLTADFGVSLPEGLPVSDPDLCALFGNALDNAIEAASRADDKRVAVRARADKGLLMLRVQNAYAGRRQPSAPGRFSTTKADKAAHGFGLAGMREIAVRHGGTLEANADDGRFELLVCLPIK